MKKKYRKIKIKLTKKNEQKFREIYQFLKRDYSFEVFVNDWIADELYMNGF